GAGPAVTALEAVDRAHQRLGPGVVAVGGAGGDAGDLVVAVVAHVGGVLAGERGVVLGAHVPAAAPGLVADAGERHGPRLVPAGLAAPRRPRRVVGAGEGVAPAAQRAQRAGAGEIGRG